MRILKYWNHDLKMDVAWIKLVVVKARLKELYKVYEYASQTKIRYDIDGVTI